MKIFKDMNDTKCFGRIVECFTLNDNIMYHLCIASEDDDKLSTTHILISDADSYR